ncbi:MAG: DNA polymerase III subunit beta [Muribaculaceae bacterium]|nr:DNA polymerase III subunit beta [Muribaculaceae bacterium]
MKFTVSSRALYSTLSGVSKTINSKNTLTVLDNFLLEVDAEKELLTVTASDTENTLVARLAVSQADESGRFLANAKRLCDIGKELPAVDVEISVDLDSLAMQIDFPGGKFDLVALDANQYPVSSDPLAEISATDGDVPAELLLPSSMLMAGIENTMFAVATDQIRPQLMGILWDVKPDGIIFVATDTRKLVKYENKTAAPGIERRLILPLKPAVLLKQLLAKEEDVKVVLTDKSATFTTEKLTLSCRLIKGNFPPYERVIPADNPYVATFDRESILTAVRRVSVCADPAHGLMKLRFTHGLLEIKVDDTSHSTFAVEKVPCDYNGRDIVIGFSAGYLIEIFNTLPTENILMKLADPSRPGVFVPDENAENTELVIILMPMTVQDF